MRTYKTFWDLKNAVAYSDVNVQQYANHTTYGGGQFKWVINNGAVTDIPGIRIQPTGATTLGYFERIMGNEILADWFGPIHANTTFVGAGLSAAQGLALYPGVTVTTSGDPAIPYSIATTDNIDWAALQQAITYACNSKKPLKMGGNFYYVNKSLYVNKLTDVGATYFNLDGGSSEIWTTNNNAFVVLNRQSPNDNTQATNDMTGCRFLIENLKMSGTSTQIGISLGPSYNSIYTNLLLVSFGIGLHLRFALNTSVTSCESNLCKIGFIADRGGTTVTSTNSWPGGGGLATSQSNCTNFLSCRTVMDGTMTGTYGFMIIDADACSVRNSVCEGGGCESGVFFDSLGATVVYNFVVDNVHFEGDNGGSDSYSNGAIKLNSAAGNFQISNIYGQHPSILIDAADASAETAITVSGIYYWVPSAIDSCYFRGRSTAYNWLFLHCSKNFTGNSAALYNRFSTNNGTGGVVGLAHTYQATLTTTDVGGGPWYKMIPTTQ